MTCGLEINCLLYTKVAQTIYFYSKSIKTKRRAIYRYAVSLRIMWVGAFGDDKAILRQEIQTRIEKITIQKCKIIQENTSSNSEQALVIYGTT